MGLHFFKILLDYCGLTRDSRILDVDCGIGRNAIPLTTFLHTTASYEGIDIMPNGIEYCMAKIKSKFPAFNFQKVDFFNSFYNPQGKIFADKYTFPYDDNSFDIVISTSVFTHLPPLAVENYIKETSRVLKNGGYCMHTCFMINSESNSGIEQVLGIHKFTHEMDGFVTTNPDFVEEAIAPKEEGFVRFYLK